MRTLKTEVVVVGGGAAGTYAAIQLQQKGIMPLLISKGFVGKSGAAIFAGNLVLSGRVLSNSEECARNTAEFLIKYHNQFLIDQNYARRCGEWIGSVYYPELEEAGLYLRRDDEGNVVTSPGKIRSVAANFQGNSGVPFMDLRRKQVLRAGIPTIEEATATALLVNKRGAVCGLTVLDYVNGELIAVSARAVILATGYSDRLYSRSTGTREMSADGIAMAYRAGAELVNLEMQWWHTNDVRHPRNWQRMQVYPNPILGSPQSARMINSDGVAFFNQQEDDPMAYGPYTVQLKSLVRQVRAGKAKYDGGYFAGFDHLDSRDLRALEAYTTYAKVFKQVGLDVASQPVETAVTAHYRQGGILLDPATMRATIPGLYVAGGVGGHSNGLIALVTFDGKVVAEAVATDLQHLCHDALPEEQVSGEVSRIGKLLRPLQSNGVTPAYVKARIRELMWDKMGVEKDASGMQSALEGIGRIREELLPRMGLKNTTRRLNYGWLDAVDAFNMLDACELIVHSSLNRKESRGPFIRKDHPEMDNENWLVQNILIPDLETGHHTFRTEPYSLPYFRPDFARKDNLQVAW